MTAATDSLLLKFRDKDTRFGVTRSTVKALAGELDITETQVVHMALAKFAEQLLPAYEADDAALTAPASAERGTMRRGVDHAAASITCAAARAAPRAVARRARAPSRP